MSATIGLAVTMIEVEKRRLREKLLMATKALRQIEELVEQSEEQEGEDLRGSMDRLRWVASSAATLIDEQTPCRPGAGKRVVVTFVRRSQGYGFAVEPLSNECDPIDRMQVELAFSAISDWLSITGAKKGQSVREAQDAALEALRERSEAVLPGYKIVIREEG